MQDLVANQIQVMVDQSANSLPQVRAGKIRAHAVTAKKRSPADASVDGGVLLDVETNGFCDQSDLMKAAFLTPSFQASSNTPA